MSASASTSSTRFSCRRMCGTSPTTRSAPYPPSPWRAAHTTASTTGPMRMVGPTCAGTATFPFRPRTWRWDRGTTSSAATTTRLGRGWFTWPTTAWRRARSWTWGNHEFGYAWDHNLTDEDGPYLELTAGGDGENQPDFVF